MIRFSRFRRGDDHDPILRLREYEISIFIVDISKEFCIDLNSNTHFEKEGGDQNGRAQGSQGNGDHCKFF